jgi:D-3-phosphoglycerate dehydrogenase / 2-oxoglutarate reductase
VNKVLITTVPFAKTNRLPLELLEAAGIEYCINPLDKKLTSDELREMIFEFDAVIAGTEEINSDVLKNAPKLKIISRVGVGLDGVDLNFAKSQDIIVTYTPDAPAPAVAELTIGNIISLLRGTHLSNIMMHQKKWERIFGRRIPEVTIGIIGAGRIGGRVLRRLAAFGTPRILVNDISPNVNVAPQLKIEWVDKETIYKEADVISLHVPLTKVTNNMITSSELGLMKNDALLINCARGGVINESDLADALRFRKIGDAAIDCFDFEPYSGPLTEIDSCLLTSHMGSMSVDCRSRMEIEASEEVVRYFSRTNLKNVVPGSEYLMQSET